MILLPQPRVRLHTRLGGLALPAKTLKLPSYPGPSAIVQIRCRHHGKGATNRDEGCLRHKRSVLEVSMTLDRLLFLQSNQLGDLWFRWNLVPWFSADMVEIEKNDPISSKERLESYNGGNNVPGNGQLLIWSVRTTAIHSSGQTRPQQEYGYRETSHFIWRLEPENIKFESCDWTRASVFHGKWFGRSKQLDRSKSLSTYKSLDSTNPLYNIVEEISYHARLRLYGLQ
jgi:hypothetical protein